MSNLQTSSMPQVDLVIVIDTSPSMRDEANALSASAQAAIEGAKSVCPSDLRLAWFGIEGTWKKTNFDRTIRDYLMQACNIPESAIRGRKRGELASAGAQEDGARAIEDICNHFDWRDNAARAIFYLGDEALEGGGEKSDQDDIEAANRAIATATAAGVTVHTYFGTSKSKHRDSIAKEYIRVAAQTRGQAFMDRDAIDGFRQVLEKVICGSRTLQTGSVQLKPGTVYIQDCVSGQLSNLYTLDISTGKATFIGAIATEVVDLTFVGSKLYGLDQTKPGQTTLFLEINPITGEPSVIGDVGFVVIGLAYNRQRNTLYASTAKQLIAINPETGTGTPAVTIKAREHNCGEIAFAADGTAYITLIGYDRKKLLATCDFDTGKVNIIGNIGFPALTSMEFVGDVLYGVTGNFFNLGKDGQLIRIDTNTGAGTLVTMTEPISRWAGMGIYGEVPAQKLPREEPVREESKEEVTSETVTSQSETQPDLTTEPENKELVMNLLTIDPKDNCYVIDPNGMGYLQDSVATSINLDKGTYTIRLTEGRYSYAQDRTEGEPFVLLWIFGSNGSTFINKNTNFEIGATWTTLNGYDDTLVLEIKNRATICALFFDVNKTDNSGAVTVSITSEKPYFHPQTLRVDSQKNCYILDENYLSTLKQWQSNYIELNPGHYEIKIRPDSGVSYWSDGKKFDLEPWALLWVKGGKFIIKQTGFEVGETWCSLNGFNDRVRIEVKEKTTLCGLFFDTFKDDNQGQIYLTLESYTATVTPVEIDASIRIGGDTVNPLSKEERIPVEIDTPPMPIGGNTPNPFSKGKKTPVGTGSMTQKLTTTHNYYLNLSFDSFGRDPQRDIVCVSPVRTIVRREEEIILVRKIRKVEEIDASPSCPANTAEISQQLLEVHADARCQEDDVKGFMEDIKNRIIQDKHNLNQVLKNQFVSKLLEHGKLPSISNTWGKTVKIKVALDANHNMWNYGNQEGFQTKVYADGNLQMSEQEREQKDMLFQRFTGKDGKVIPPSALVAFKFKKDKSSSDNESIYDYVTHGSTLEFSLEKDETVYFINNDEPGFYDDNKEVIKGKYWIV